MTSPFDQDAQNQPHQTDHLTLVIRAVEGLALVVTIVGALGVDTEAGFRSTGLAYPCLVLLGGVVLAGETQIRQNAVPGGAQAFALLLSVAVATCLFMSHIPAAFGCAIWSIETAVGLLVAGILGSRQPGLPLLPHGRRFKALGLVLVMVFGLAVALNATAQAAHSMVTGILSGSDEGGSVSAPATTSGKGLEGLPEDDADAMFPSKDSVCTGRFPEEVPANVPVYVWEAIRYRAGLHRAWGLCQIGGPVAGADGLYDQKVYGSMGGPEGHILVRVVGNGALVSAFVPPPVGQLYYQQPDGDPLLSWGMPDSPTACGRRWLVIFRSATGAPVGYALWSAKPIPNDPTQLNAFYVPARFAAPLLDVLGRADPLPLASGPPKDGVQSFGSRTVAEVPDALLDEGRLLQQCGE